MSSNNSEPQAQNLESPRIPRRPVPLSPKYSHQLEEGDKIVVPVDKTPSLFSDKDTHSQVGSEPRRELLPDHHNETEQQKNQVNHRAEPDPPKEQVYDQSESEPPKSRDQDVIEAQPYRNEPRRNPWGLSPLAFAALVALITAVVVGAIVGGSVSTVKKDCPASQTTSASSSTATGTAAATPSTTGVVSNYVPFPPAQVDSLASNCSTISGTKLTSNKGSTFSAECPVAIDGSQGPNGTTLSALIAYTLQDCINACAGMNYWKTYNLCVSVTWDSGMAGIVGYVGANCWLFSNSSLSHAKDNNTSAFLVTS